MHIKELKEKLQAKLLEARAICDAAEKGKREFSDDERAKVAALMAEADALKAELKKLENDEELRKQILLMGEGLEMAASGQPAGGGPGVPGKGRTIGEMFVNSPEYKAWMGRFPNRQIPESMHGLSSPPVEFKNLFEHLFERKTLVTGESVTSAGAFVTPDYSGIYEPLGRIPLTIRDLVSIGQTTSDLVEFVRQTKQVTEAAPTPEATATETDGYDVKPEAGLAFEKVTAPVKTIPVWIPATKRALADAAQLRSLIDSELRDDVDEELENQMINGSGAGENFYGVLHTVGVLTQAWDTDIFRTTRKAKTYLEVTGRARPTAYVMNPEDWETIELTMDMQGRYYYGGPVNNGQKQLWSVPVVECPSVAKGQIILGDWRKAKLWNRQQATISMTDGYMDFFVRNLVAILCEMRAAFGLIRPHGFVIIDANAGT